MVSAKKEAVRGGVKCPICGEPFSDGKELIDHWLRMHAGPLMYGPEAVMNPEEMIVKAQKEFELWNARKMMEELQEIRLLDMKLAKAERYKRLKEIADYLGVEPERLLRDLPASVREGMGKEVGSGMEALALKNLVKDVKNPEELERIARFLGMIEAYRNLARRGDPFTLFFLTGTMPLPQAQPVQGKGGEEDRLKELEGKLMRKIEELESERRKSEETGILVEVLREAINALKEREGKGTGSAKDVLDFMRETVERLERRWSENVTMREEMARLKQWLDDMSKNPPPSTEKMLEATDSFLRKSIGVGLGDLLRKAFTGGEGKSDEIELKIKKIEQEIEQSKQEHEKRMKLLDQEHQMKMKEIENRQQMVTKMVESVMGLISSVLPTVLQRFGVPVPPQFRQPVQGGGAVPQPSPEGVREVREEVLRKIAGG